MGLGFTQVKYFLKTSLEEMEHPKYNENSIAGAQRNKKEFRGQNTNECTQTHPAPATVTLAKKFNPLPLGANAICLSPDRALFKNKAPLTFYRHTRNQSHKICIQFFRFSPSRKKLPNVHNFAGYSAAIQREYRNVGVHWLVSTGSGC